MRKSILFILLLLIACATANPEVFEESPSDASTPVAMKTAIPTAEPTTTPTKAPTETPTLQTATAEPTFACNSGDTLQKSWPYNISGVMVPFIGSNYLSNDKDSSYKSIDTYVSEFVSLGVNHVKLTISAGVMANCTDNDFDSSLAETNSEADLVSFADKLREVGISVSIFPFVHVHNKIAGSEGCDRPYPSNPTEWFDNFSTSTIENAKLAQAMGATHFGMFQDEIQHLTLDPDLTSRWIQLIKDVREVYSGTITANIWTNGETAAYPSQIPASIINELDVIGIGFFPKFTDKNDPTVQELIDSYSSNLNGVDLLNHIISIHDTYGKNILITDRAFHSFDGANKDESVIFDTSVTKTLDEGEQKDQFEAFFQVLSCQNWSWFDGVIFSSWLRQQMDSPDYLGSLGEVFEGKEAETTVKEWFDAP